MLVLSELRGFYAVLDRDDEALARALVGPGGAKILQVRLKPATAAEILAAAKMARRVCDEHGALMVVNDRVDIAVAARADAVHLGQTDLPIAAARAFAPGLAVGVSTHNVAQVRAAVAAGADYLGFGPIFQTATKANPGPVVGVDGLRAAVAAAGRTPVVAIGGISPRDAPDLYAAGAAAICAIGAVNHAADIIAAARAFSPATLRA